MEYFFTGDEHHLHEKINEFENAPFSSTQERTEEIIKRHNEIVGKRDIIIHAGDFTLKNRKEHIQHIIKRLKGQHIFLRGSHDYWLGKSAPTRWEKKVGDVYIVVDHYQMTTWPRKHYGSWQLYGHSHGGSTPEGLQHDIGLITNNFYPYSFEQLKEIMEKRSLH